MRRPSRSARCAVLALLAVGAAFPAPAVGAAGPPSPPAPASTAAPTPDSAGEPWWVQVGLGGDAVTAVSARGLDLFVATAGQGPMRSLDAGASFHPAETPPATGGEVRTGSDTWAIRGGRVEHARDGDGLTPDPGSPELGAGAGLLAAPGSLPGTVIAVATDGVVWRRDPAGAWSRVLLLLPRGLLAGPPRVTAVTAFAEPVSDTIYVGTDGYSVLDSTDGGVDWIRAGPGLPDTVLSLASDPATASVYAGTGDGLWVHHLRPVPRPPVYVDTGLQSRQLGTAAVTLGAAGLGVVGLFSVLRRGGRRRRSS